MARFNFTGSIEVTEGALTDFMVGRAVASEIEAKLEEEIYSNLESVLPSGTFEVRVEEETQ